MKLDRIIAVRTGKTVFRDGDDCVKVFDHDYAASDILNEALNQARAEETGLPVPKIKEVTMIDGKWAIVSEYIPGKTFARLMEEAPQEREKLLSQFVDIQLLLQQKDCALLPKLKDKMNRKLSLLGVDPSIKRRLRAQLDAMPKTKKLCHGDFCLTNVILQEDKTPFILDWSHASQGAPAADAARSYLAFLLDDQKENAETYLENYCQKSRCAKRDIRMWLPLVSATLAVTANENDRARLLALIHAGDKI